MQGVLEPIITNLLENLPVKEFDDRLRFDRLMAMNLLYSFLAHPVDLSAAI